MASHPPQIAPLMPTPAAAPPVDHAIFGLSRPLKDVRDGVEIELHGIGMRAFGAAELSLLDRFHGQPIALAQNLLAALCEITVEQVQQLDLDDFTMLASDALWQVEQLSISMGLPARFFLQPHAKDAQV